jgi:transcription elongation factor GreA
MMDLDEAKQLALNKEYVKLEDVWTDLIMKTQAKPDAYFTITDLIQEAAETDRASLLLDILSEHYETYGDYDSAIMVQKHMLRYRKEDPDIRKKIIEIYRKKHADSLHIEDYLEHSGLNTDRSIMKALERFEEYETFDVGKYFYFERYGMGKVVDTNPGKREIVVDFERKKKHFLAIDVARGLLTPVDEDHFLYQKYKHIETLRSLARSDPDRLLVLLLRSIREPLSATQIKGFLEDIIDKSKLARFWEKARKDLEKHENIRVIGKTAKTYVYVKSAEDKQEQAIASFHKAGIREKYELAEEYMRKTPDVFDTLLPHLNKLGNAVQHEHPGIALDILMLLQEVDQTSGLTYSTDDILRSSSLERILKGMTNHEHQHRLLDILQERSPENWVDTASKLVFTIHDFRMLDALIQTLRNTPRTLDDIYHRIMAMPKQYPKQFHWLLKRIAAGSLPAYMKPAFITRIIDSLEYVRGIKATAREILTLDNFDTVIKEAQVDEAARIRDAINKSSILIEYDKLNYIRIIEHHFPDLAEEKSDIIFTTEAALKQKKEELKRIITVEIPENKKEIGRAREFGDLSENFEYKAAKEKQDQLFQKAKTIESELQRTQLIEADKVSTDLVAVGTAVTLQRTDNESLVVYRILGRWDTDLKNNVISNEAPLARSMLGKHIGDAVNIEGIDHKIVAITRAL